MTATLIKGMAATVAAMAFAGCIHYDTPENYSKPTSPEEETPTTPDEPGGQYDTLSFRFMQFNIRESTAEVAGYEWSNRCLPVYKMLKETDPDLVTLQECRRDQLNFLQSFFKEYSYFMYAKDGILKSGKDPGCTDDSIFQNGGQRNVIMLRTSLFEMIDWGRFWLSATPDEPSRAQWNGSTGQKVTLWLKIRDLRYGSDMYVMNTHVVPYDQGECRLECSLLNMSQLKSIVGDTTASGKGTDRTVVFYAGDLNMDCNHCGMAPVNDWMWNATLTAPDADQSETYNGFRENKWTRLDYIFYRNAVPKDFVVVKDQEKYGIRFISDHFPVYSDFEVYLKQDRS